MANIVQGEWDWMRGLPFEYGPQVQDVSRQTKMADILRQQAQEMPQGQMVSGHFVAPSFTQYMANALKGYQANQMQKDAEAKSNQIIKDSEAKKIAASQKFANALRGKPVEQQVDMVDAGGMPGVTETIMQKPDFGQAMMDYIGSGYADPAMLAWAQGEQNYQRGRSDKLDDREWQAAREDQNYSRNRADSRADRQEGWAHDAEMKKADQEFQRILMKEQQGFALTQQERNFAQQFQMQKQAQAFQAGQQAKAQSFQASENAKSRESKNNPESKPLPAPALKMQQEAIEKMQTARNINTDLAGYADLIDQGKLDFGLGTNAINKARNWTGASTEQSRNFGSFTSSLEKLRNDSLRLNSGVQTEGDAQRAWNELFSNINDKQLVRQRLNEIQEINKRAELLQQMNIDNVRANYGHEPLQVKSVADAPVTNRGATSSWGEPPAGAVRRKGK